MYRTIIELKQGLSDSEYARIKTLIERAFRNRAGSVKNSSQEKYLFVFETEEHDLFCCLGIANLSLDKKGFCSYFEKWLWEEDEDPSENEDLKKMFMDFRHEEKTAV